MSHPHEVKNCNCGASMFMAPTKAGKKVPLCERPDPLGTIYLNDEHEAVYVSGENPAPPGASLYRTHFADCPFAEQFRTKR